ncbi:MAG: diguanylate cyclase [Burkholderiales bacterium]
MKRVFSLKVLFWAALLVMAANALTPLQTLEWVRVARDDLTHVERNLDTLHEILALLTQAESGARGYALSGEADFLEPYHGALSRLRDLIGDSRTEFAADAQQSSKLKEVLPLVDLRLRSLEALVATRRDKGLGAAVEMVNRSDSRPRMDRIRGDIGSMIDLEQERVTNGAAELERRVKRATTIGVTVSVINMGMLVVLFVLGYRTLRERANAEIAQRTTAESLARGLAELEIRNQQISLLAELAVGLESPSSMEETLRTIGLFGAQLFRDTSAAVYLFRPSLNVLERGSTWGDPQGMPEVLDPAACWALRRGQPHTVRSKDQDLICPHSAGLAPDTLPQLCLPLMAQGEILGLVCVQATQGTSWVADERAQRLARAFSEQISLGLSSFSLRETLRRQSIVDSLTGLYNRRYLDETLRREVFRAKRSEKALSVIMLDADHFKRLNDTFGHDAGDVALRGLGEQLRSGVRAGDIACRYGGEEFALVLADCGKEQALQRARRIAQNVRELRLVHGGTPLQQITISGGVATYPEDGEEAEQLIAAADRALYAAKQSGRDRVLGTERGESSSAVGATSTKA